MVFFGRGVIGGGEVMEVWLEVFLGMCRYWRVGASPSDTGVILILIEILILILSGAVFFGTGSYWRGGGNGGVA